MLCFKKHNTNVVTQASKNMCMLCTVKEQFHEFLLHSWHDVQCDKQYVLGLQDIEKICHMQYKTLVKLNHSLFHCWPSSTQTHSCASLYLFLQLPKIWILKTFKSIKTIQILQILKYHIDNFSNIILQYDYFNHFDILCSPITASWHLLRKYMTYMHF